MVLTSPTLSWDLMDHVLSLVSNTPDESRKKQIVTFKVNINSPSTFGLNLGDILFNTAGLDGRSGTTTLKDMVLKRGDNILTAVMVIDSSLAGAAGFMSGLETADATVILQALVVRRPTLRSLPPSSLPILMFDTQKFTPKTV
ncbi:hypothetical protein BGZ81_004356 [Podila clonocystis]|nr:hypothetical protein BGZ81_004356 [Podila clonocystis]